MQHANKERNQVLVVFLNNPLQHARGKCATLAVMAMAMGADAVEYFAALGQFLG